MSIWCCIVFVIVNGFLVWVTKKDETITFRFNPEHNSEFTQTVSEKKIKRFEGFGSQEDLSRSTYVFNIQYNEPLWDFNVSLGDVSMFRDGGFCSSFNSSDERYLITYKVNAQGQAVEIEGFDIVSSKALSQLPPDIQAGMASVFTPEVLSEAALIEYNARVGDFVGATVSIGDVWEWQVPMTLANGVSLDYVGKTQFTKWTDFNGVKVLQIDIHYNSQVDELGNLIEPILSSMKRMKIFCQLLMDQLTSRGQFIGW